MHFLVTLIQITKGHETQKLKEFVINENLICPTAINRENYQKNHKPIVIMSIQSYFFLANLVLNLLQLC